MFALMLESGRRRRVVYSATAGCWTTACCTIEMAMGCRQRPTTNAFDKEGAAEGARVQLLVQASSKRVVAVSSWLVATDGWIGWVGWIGVLCAVMEGWIFRSLDGGRGAQTSACTSQVMTEARIKINYCIGVCWWSRRRVSDGQTTYVVASRKIRIQQRDTFHSHPR